ncbi:ankyrin [Ophiobolus disseminans]|uniref:Ankyrin n=1 Tax=Ophiobolus disseminans TaxID=1469910 RepID=A0A6A6ZDS8_9PLEO|nr:ankyrin [Ophiobolus disseminans]
MASHKHRCGNKDCAKSFNTEGQLNRHSKVHTKPFQCPICERGFALRLDMSRHVKARHRLGHGKYACPIAYCTFKATRKDNLAQHERNMHMQAQQLESIEAPKPPKIMALSANSNDQSDIHQSPPNHAPQEQLWSCAMFLQAATAGNLAVLEACFDSKIDIDTAADDGSSALHCAARAGQELAVHFLLEKEADISARNRKGRSPLEEALVGKSKGTIERLLGKGAKLGSLKVAGACITQSGSFDIIQECFSLDGSTLDELKNQTLYAASALGRTSLVSALLSQVNDQISGDDPAHLPVPAWRRLVDGREELLWAKQGNRNQYTPIHLASLKGHYEIVRLLVQHQFKVNMLARGLTPLHLAAKAGHVSVVEYLLGLGSIEINPKDQEGRMPRDLAAISGHLDIVELFHRQANIDTRCHDTSGLSILQLSAIHGRWNVAQAFLDHEEGPQVHGTPLHSLDQRQAAPFQIVVGLLQHPDFSNINIVDNDMNRGERRGEGLLHVAVRQNECDVIRLLLDREDINVNIDTRGSLRTPLHKAIELGHSDAAKLLLQHNKFDASLRGKWVAHPLTMARKKGLDEIVELLLARGVVDPKNEALMSANARNTALDPNMVYPEVEEPAECDLEVQPYSFLDEYMNDSPEYMVDETQALDKDTM